MCIYMRIDIRWECAMGGMEGDALIDVRPNISPKDATGSNAFESHGCIHDYQQCPENNMSP